MRFSTLLFSFVFGSLFEVNAQNIIQWSSGLEFQYNQYADVEYSGKEALGAPNSQPYGRTNPKAFRLNKEAAFGTLVLTFDKPQSVTQVIIVENNEPGRITEVFLIDTKANKHSVFKGNPLSLDDPFRAMMVAVPKTHYQVSKIEINVNSITNPGWSQIDAVGISNSDATSISKELLKYGNLNPDAEVVFSTPKKNLDKTINTEYIETKPIISPDGKTLYFCRQNHPDNLKGERDEQDIYLSNKVNDAWSKAVNVGEPLNDKFPNGVCSVSPDGNTVLLINAYDEKGNISPGVSISKRQKGGWSVPRKMNIKGFYNDSGYQDYYLANSGRVLILAIQTSDTYGDQDLYASFHENGDNWSKPINLGATINSEKGEFSPFLAADNKTLYFASEGHKGLGQSDIFYTKRLDDTWTRWTKPRNLGNAVNSKDIDAYYAVSASGDLAYFVSTQGSTAGSRDIFSIELPSEFKPEPVLLVKGKVYNKKTNLAMESEIIITSLPGGEEEGLANSTPYTGTYQIVLPQGKNYSVRASAKGFLAVEQNLDLATIDSYKEIEQDLYLAPIELNQTITLTNVFFVKSRSELLPESFPELQRLVELLKLNSSMSIELGGHTDNQGVAKANLELSEERVQVVKQYLIKNGLESKRISTKAYGGTRPIFPNTNEDGRSKNRRVDLTVTSF